MKVNHIGYLCSNIPKTIVLFESLGYKQTSSIFVDDHSEDSKPRNVLICFVENEQTRVELVCPINEQSDVSSILKRQGEGPYHICYEVSNLDDSINELKLRGWFVIKSPAKAIAFCYARVAFLYRKGAGLIELVELEKSDL